MFLKGGGWGVTKPRQLILVYNITNLTKTRTYFVKSPEWQEAFQQLEDKLLDAPIWVRAKAYQSYVLTTDATNSHVEAVLAKYKMMVKVWLVISQRNLNQPRPDTPPRIEEP